MVSLLVFRVFETQGQISNDRHRQVMQVLVRGATGTDLQVDPGIVPKRAVAKTMEGKRPQEEVEPSRRPKRGNGNQGYGPRRDIDRRCPVQGQSGYRNFRLRSNSADSYRSYSSRGSFQGPRPYLTRTIPRQSRSTKVISSLG